MYELGPNLSQGTLVTLMTQPHDRSPRSIALAPWAVSVAIGCVLTLATAAHASSGWETIATEAGIEVTQKERPGGELPVVKGVGLVRANLVDVLAVIDDVPGRTKWAHDCTASRELEKSSPFERILYHRSAVDWPLDDRDAVVRVRVDADYDAQRVRVTYRTARDYRFPEVSGVVRMPRLDGYFLIEAVGETRTRVTYVVDADPGGMIPDWLVSMTSKDIPLNTLQNLRRRVRSTRSSGKYKAFVDHWLPYFFPQEVKTDKDS